MTASRRLLLLLAAALAAVGLSAALGRAVMERRPGAQAIPVRLFGPMVPVEPVSTVAEEGEVRIVVAALLTPTRALVAYEKLFGLLEAELGRPVRMVRRRTYREVNELLLSGSAPIGFVCGGAFVAAEDRGLELLAVPIVHGAPTNRSYLIIRKMLPAESFDDLRGASFALMDPLSNSGCLYPAALAAERGAELSSFFGSILWTGSHESSIQAVAHGLVDGAAVHSLVYEYLRERDPALVGKTRIMARSPPFGIEPVVVSPRAPPELRARVKELLLGMHTTPEGRSALADLGVDRFEDRKPDLYDGVRAMRRAARLRAGD